jgi:hypothetical protein
LQSYSHQMPRPPLKVSTRVATKWLLPIAVGALFSVWLTGPTLIVVSVIVNEYGGAGSSIHTLPFIKLLRITTPDALMFMQKPVRHAPSPLGQLMILESMTVPATVTSHDPV